MILISKWEQYFLLQIFHIKALYGFLNSFFQNSWSQRFAKVRLTGKYNYKYLHLTHISGGNKISRICENEYTQIFQYRHYYTFLPYTKNSESDFFTVHPCTFYTDLSPFILEFGHPSIHLKFFPKRVEPLFSSVQKTIQKYLLLSKLSILVI